MAPLSVCHVSGVLVGIYVGMSVCWYICRNVSMLVYRSECQYAGIYVGMSVCCYICRYASMLVNMSVCQYARMLQHCLSSVHGMKPSAVEGNLIRILY